MPPAQLDHIVILLPYRDLVSPPSWLRNNFSVTPGGRHSDGRTENKLIIFSDGTYLELIAFINDSPALRAGHPWGNKSYGIIDFALTTPGSLDYNGLRTRIQRVRGGLGIDYAVPSELSRRRSDGKEVKFAVTQPVHVGRSASPPDRRGELPFFCTDSTQRSLRVDMSKATTTHPCGALGIAQVSVLVPREKVDRYVELYAAVIDTNPVRVFGTTRLLLATPNSAPGIDKPWVFVEEPTIEEETKRIREKGPGVVEVALRVGGGGKVGVARNPIREQGVWIHFLH